MRLSTQEREALREALAEITPPGYRRHDRMATRLIAAYRSASYGRDTIPDVLIPVEDLRLDVLTYRWGPGAAGEPRPRMPLATYRLAAEATGSERFRFVLERVVDAASRRALENHPVTARIALSLHHAGQDAESNEWSKSLVLPAFERVRDLRWLPRFDKIPKVENDRLGESSEERLAHPIGGGEPPHPDRDELSPAVEAQSTTPPVAAQQVVVNLADLRGRAVRNPAFGVLLKHGIIPFEWGEPGWKPMLDGTSSGNSQAWLRESWERHTTWDSERERDIRRDLAAACMAVGILLRGGPRGAAATEMLRRPWEPVDRPHVCRAIPIRLAGPPGPNTAIFASPTVHADLSDFGPAAASLDGCPHDMVLAGIASRRGKPPRKPAIGGHRNAASR